jgi:hypothetical protein
MGLVDDSFDRDTSHLKAMGVHPREGGAINRANLCRSKSIIKLDKRWRFWSVIGLTETPAI